MGLYDDLQRDIIKAFNTDLLDATRTIQYVEITSNYDPITMENVLTETPIDVRAVKVKDKEGENMDNPSLSNSAKFLIMDEDRIKSNLSFEIGIKVVDINENPGEYKIEGIDTDPAHASWELDCRRWS